MWGMLRGILGVWPAHLGLGFKFMASGLIGLGIRAKHLGFRVWGLGLLCHNPYKQECLKTEFVLGTHCLGLWEEESRDRGFTPKE